MDQIAVVSLVANLVILAFQFKIKADIAELKVYAHQTFEPKRGK